MTGRIGDRITHPALTRCEGCGQTLILCDCCWDHDDEPCCGVCTHVRDLRGIRVEPNSEPTLGGNR